MWGFLQSWAKISSFRNTEIEVNVNIFLIVLNSETQTHFYMQWYNLSVFRLLLENTVDWVAYK